MNYGQIRKYDIANGTGIRASLFVTGCRRHCKNCFNTEYQDFKAGTEFGLKERDLLLQSLKNPSVSGLSILGGEPFEQENADALSHLLVWLEWQLGKPFSVWIYSGFTYEELINNRDTLKLLLLCDVLVDGPFIDELKDPSLRFRGSKNQRIIDIPESFLQDRVCLYKGVHNGTYLC